MAASEMAVWVEIVASLAVLVTLVFLTVQIRQTNALMRSEARQAQVINDMVPVQARRARRDHLGFLSAGHTLYTRHTAGACDLESLQSYLRSGIRENCK